MAKQKQVKNQWIDNSKTLSQVYCDLHSRIKILHPTRPLMITDFGFKVKVQDLNSVKTMVDCPDTQDASAHYLEMPFTNKITQIESITLSQDGNYLICIVKTSEQPFQLSNLHLVIFNLATFGTCAHYVIPGIHQGWDHPSPGELGQAVKVIE